jgi:hypothetical protein
MSPSGHFSPLPLRVMSDRLGWKAAIRISFLPKLIVEPHAAAQAAAAQHGDMASPIASCQPLSAASR